MLGADEEAVRAARARAGPRGRPTSGSTRAPRSSSRSRRTSTARTRRSARPTRRRGRRSSFSAAARTASARASSSTTAAARRLRAARRRVRDRHDQLQPRDGVDRLRHGRSAVLRAADVRGRLGDHRARAAQRRRRRRASCSTAGQTPLKLALPLQDAGVEDPRHVARLDRPRGGSRALLEAAAGSWAFRRRRAARRRRRRKRREVALRIGFPLVVRPSYVLGGRAMAIVYDMAALDRYMTTRRAGVAGAPGAHRQVPRGRRRARRRRRGRRHRRRRHRRHHGAHRGGGHPLGRQLVRRAAVPDRRSATSSRFATTRAASRAR